MKSARDAKLHERCSVLADIIQSVAPIYHASNTTANQRHLIETMIGAAIWYLPTGPEYWTGRISLKAVQNHHPASGIDKPKLTADHEFPRKVAAYELMHTNWGECEDPAAEMLHRYKTQYGLYNLIAPGENRRLMRFQRRDVFADVAQSYNEAGVILITVTPNTLADVKARNLVVIDELLNGHKSLRP